MSYCLNCPYVHLFVRLFVFCQRVLIATGAYRVGRSRHTDLFYVALCLLFSLFLLKFLHSAEVCTADSIAIFISSPTGGDILVSVVEKYVEVLIGRPIQLWCQVTGVVNVMRPSDLFITVVIRPLFDNTTYGMTQKTHRKWASFLTLWRYSR